MRKIVLLAGLIVLLGVAVLAQSPRIVPCIVDVGTAGADGKHLAQWQPRTAEKSVVKIAPGTELILPFSMPVDGNCVGSFTAFDDREEMAINYMNASGKTVSKQPKGDVEVLILDVPGMEARNKHEKFAASYSGGIVTDGKFSAELTAGDYFVVISNKHSDKIPKKIVFWFGSADKQN
ncbi:MAG: hypothetical protein ABJA02_13525 [Acidobacteriota bacterium]